MNKKFIVGVLLMAVSVIGFSTFTSCKDTNEDLRTEMNKEYVSLKVALEKLQSQLSQCPNTCQQKIDSLEKVLKEMINKKADYDELMKELQGLYVLKATYESAISTINSRLAALEGQFTASDIQNLKELIALKSQLEGLFGENGTIAGIQNSIAGLQNSITGIQNLITDLQNALTGVQNSITAINDILNGKDGKIGLLQWFENIGLTVEQFQTYVKQGEFIITNKAALEYLIRLKNEGTLNEDALKALNSMYQNLAGINTMYDTIFKGVEAPEGGWWNYAEVINNIKNNTKAIEELQSDVEKLIGRLNDMVTGLILQFTANPVFGGFNSPFGLNSMVLMTCYGERTTAVDVFPICGRGAECNTPEQDDIDWSTITSDKVNLGTTIVDVDENNQAKLGYLWFTVNPGTVNNLDLKGFALVNSREDEPVVALNNIVKDDETLLKFGITTPSRAAGNGNGLYQTNVTCDPERLGEIKVHIQPDLANTFKDAVKNHTASDMVAMFKAVYQQLKDVCDANALRYTYEAYTGKNADGTWNKSTQKVYSNYGIAATAFKPLSFATLKGTSSSAKVPTISPIQISKDRVNLNLGTFTVDSKNFNLNLNFGEPEFNHVGEMIIPVTLKDENGKEVKGSINIAENANDIIDSIKKSIMDWIGTGDNSLDARVEKALWYALFNDPNAVDPKYPYDANQPLGIVADLVNQVNDKLGKIQDKLYSLVDEINKDYLNKINTLINKYNTVAEQINRVLANPNHYLQVTMLYRKAGRFALSVSNPEFELPFALLSTNPKQPTQFRGTGEAISLWATTYSFETVCPAYKKMVAVTKVTDSKGALRNDLRDAANATLAKVMNGDRNRVALDVAGATNGTYTYEIAYQAVDYSGFTSTVKCYVQVVR